MKIRWVLVFLFLSSISFSQTYLDIVRASNYYTKAIDAYESDDFQNAMKFLKESEINLQGKTNQDLVFLKIMTQYKLKKYEDAYNLLLQYFNGDYKRNRIFFKNITPYNKKMNIKYDEILTENFVDIENKYKLSKGVTTQLSPESIAMRIITEKKELAPFMRNHTNTKDITLSFRKVKEQTGENKFWTETLYFDVQTRVGNNSITLNGSKDGTDFMVICSYGEDFMVNKEAFYYTFSHNKCTAVRLSLGWKDQVGGQFKKGLAELTSKKFNTKKKEVNSVPFTDKEKQFLSRATNFDKFKAALKKQGFETE